MDVVTHHHGYWAASTLISFASVTCLWAGVALHPLSKVKNALRLSLFATLCILNICLMTFLFNDIVLAYAGCATSMALLYTGLEVRNSALIGFGEIRSDGLLDGVEKLP